MLIEFAQELQPISGITYWFLVINALASLIFTIVVTIGGVFDLKFLINALKSEKGDDMDDGRVIKDDESGKVIDQK